MKNMRGCYFEHHQHHGSKLKGFVFGIMVVVVGILLLMKNMGKLDPEVASVIFTWQSLIIAIGFLNLFNRRFLFGLLLMIFGGIFMYLSIYEVPYNFHQVFWPSLLIFVGIMVVVGTFRFRRFARRFEKTTVDSDILEEVAVFGGGDRMVRSDNFKGGKLVAVFGGHKINLMHCVLSDGGAQFEMVNVFGGSQLVIPSDWNVQIKVVNVFGGFTDKRDPVLINKDKVVKINGICVFGGGEIKSA